MYSTRSKITSYVCVCVCVCVCCPSPNLSLFSIYICICVLRNQHIVPCPSDSANAAANPPRLHPDGISAFTHTHTHTCRERERESGTYTYTHSHSHSFLYTCSTSVYECSYESVVCLGAVCGCRLSDDVVEDREEV